MEGERSQRDDRVQITRAVSDGLEFIRSSGATNMLDRPMVVHLAREWGFPETAAWIDSVDDGTYGRLIFQGPEVIEDDLADVDVDSYFDSRIEETGVIVEAEYTGSTEMAKVNMREQVAEVLTAAGADAVLEVPIYVGHFGDRRVEVRVLDFGPLFERRFEVQLKGEDGTTITVGPASTVAACLQAADWQAVLLR